MTRHAKRVDANHAEIKAVFQKMLGTGITDSSAWGQGAGDLLVSYGSYMCFIEIKVDAKATLKPAQIEFKKRHPNNWFRCESVDQAKTMCDKIRILGRTYPML